MGTKLVNVVLYVTKQVETSMTLLESPENDLVLDALTYLSIYADLHVNNLNYLQQHGILQKLLNLFDRNQQIQRLTLRFMEQLLLNESSLNELDHSKYNEEILKLSSMYMFHKDLQVKQFSASILTKLASSKRIADLILDKNLFYHILHNIQNNADVVLLEETLQLLLTLLKVPRCVNILIEIDHFNVTLMLKYMQSYSLKLTDFSFKVIDALTYFNLDPYQALLRKAKIVEVLLDIIMESERQKYHDIAINIFYNCMKSDETSNYFIRSIEFLDFCQWVKTCENEYLYFSIFVLEQLTRLPSKIQMLFDLSVEDSIVSVLRSNEKKVLNKACEAIYNMISHRFCCEHMLTFALLKSLCQILLRKDEEDPNNEVALKTILKFCRKNPRALSMVHKSTAYKVLLAYVKKAKDLSEESFLGILEILYKLSTYPIYHSDLISTNFCERLLLLVKTASNDIAKFACEIMMNFVSSSNFRRIFILLNGPEIFVNTLKKSNDPKMLKDILLFVYSNLVHKKVLDCFLHHKIVTVLKNFPEFFKFETPIVNKILKLIYNTNLSIKFFETNRLDLTDHIDNKFYLVNGQWDGDFPFLDELEEEPISTLYTVYIVDFSSEVLINTESSANGSESIISERNLPQRSLSTVTNVSSTDSSYIRRHSVQAQKKLAPDKFLPKYVTHVMKNLIHDNTIETRVKSVAQYIDILFSKLTDHESIDQVHSFELHLQMLKHKLGSNLIPVGFLRLGRHCERALLFKALADKCCIPSSLVKGKENLFWNEIVLVDSQSGNSTVRMYVVDLVHNVGNLLPVGSREANDYCHLE